MRPVMAIVIMLVMVSPQAPAISSSSSTLLGPGRCGPVSGLHLIKILKKVEVFLLAQKCPLIYPRG